MKRFCIWLCVFIVLLMLTAPVLAQDDDSPPEPTLIEETVVTDAAEVEAPAADIDTAESEVPDDDTGAAEEDVSIDDNETVLDWLRLAFENDLHWYIFAILALFLAGNLIPPDEMQRRREQARQTETPADDVLYAILEGIQMLRNNATAPTTRDALEGISATEGKAPYPSYDAAPPFVVDSIDVHVDTHKPPDPTTTAG